MNCEIIAVGTEILLGDIVNTNAQYIARGLSSIGIGVYHQTVVGDNTERLDSAINLAKSRADIIITTGGLGPTYDDMTKETIARNFSRELVLHQPSLDKMTAYFKLRGYSMTDNNKKQAYMPKDAIILENNNGTAPGCIIEGENHKIAIMLPGPPREMKPMFDALVLPYLLKFSDGVIVSKTLHIFGIGESAVEERLKDMMLSLTNPTVAPYAKDTECIVRVTAKAKTRDEAVRMIAPVAKEIYSILGDAIYGEDDENLASVAVRLMSERGVSAAFAESCTGGLLSKIVTDIPGASSCFNMGVISYSNDVKMRLLGVKEKTLKKFGAVSKECAIEMARGIYRLSDDDYGVAITGIAGPGGGSEEKPVGLVYIAVYNGKTAWVRRIVYARDRDRVRLTAAMNALDMLRTSILKGVEKL